jgi:hypothetical protein
MTLFTAWLPIIICVLILVFYILALKKKVIVLKRKFSPFGIGFLVLILSAIIILLLWRAFFVDAKPAKRWKYEAQKTNTAIIFGFGYEEDEQGNMLPDSSNVALYRQVITDANYQYLIMQKGALVAAHDDSIRTKGKNLILMHPHYKGFYVNTLRAAKYAILKMDSLQVKKAVVYAHNQQLARAVFDLKRVAASNPQWQDMEFITPYIPPTPYPCNPVDFHTRYEILYLPLELFVSRPSNTIYPLCWIKIPEP